MLLVGHKTHKCTQLDGANPRAAYRAFSLSLLHVAAFLLRRVYDNRQRATRTAAGEGGQMVCMRLSVWVCEHRHPCVWDKGAAR